ncbi:MAG: formate dehydrogenase accessory sulfurtransferase FdhD [Blastocatellia bacterium]
MSDQRSMSLPVRVVGTDAREQEDWLAVEEPLEIRLGYEVNGLPEHKAISITMRTPGEDDELAAGFLFTEGILTDAARIERMYHCGKPDPVTGLNNTMRVDLRPGVEVNLQRLERHFYTSSSCGVCGKSSIAALRTTADRVICRTGAGKQMRVSAGVIHALPETLRQSQAVFARTGGLHAAALFDVTGNLIALREDVGRHNAVDKLIGARLLAGCMPLDECLLLVSGRASFELVQKAVMAGIPLLAAVGAPSSLAVQLAREFDMTLLGFVRDGRFNVYVEQEGDCGLRNEWGVRNGE